MSWNDQSIRKVSIMTWKCLVDSFMTISARWQYYLSLNVSPYHYSHLNSIEAQTKCCTRTKWIKRNCKHTYHFWYFFAKSHKCQFYNNTAFQCNTTIWRFEEAYKYFLKFASTFLLCDTFIQVSQNIKLCVFLRHILITVCHRISMFLL